MAWRRRHAAINRGGVSLSSTSVTNPHAVFFRKAVGFLANPSLAAALVFAASGAAFAIGSLLLARVMPVTAFGHFALSIALFNIFALVAPLGVDQFGLRHRLDPSPRLAGGILVIATTMGFLVAAISAQFTGRPMLETVSLALAIAAGGLVQLASTIFRASGSKARSLLLATWASWLLLVIGCAAQLLPFSDPAAPLAYFALGNIVMAGAAWIVLFRSRASDAVSHQPIQWHESFSLLGVATVATVALQLERVIIPFTLGMPELALFSVMASSIIYPFRLLVAGTNFTLVPRLRGMDEAPARRRLVRHEILLVVPITLIVVAVMLPTAPFVVTWLTAGTYTVSFALVGAACLNGLAKLIQSFSASVVSGAGDAGAVHRLNQVSIFWILAAAAGGWLGSEYGLLGLVVGLSSAALLASTPTIVLAWRSLR